MFTHGMSKGGQNPSNTSSERPAAPCGSGVACFQRAVDDPNRGTGRTTGLMLKAISEALLRPDEWVEFIDHYRHDRNKAESHAEQLRWMADAVGLTIKTRLDGVRVWVRSPISEMTAKRW